MSEQHTAPDGGEEMNLSLDAIEGVMQVLQVLVMCLDKQGHLDGGEYAAMLADWRIQHVPPDSLQEAIVDRMIDTLVDDPRALIRRMGMLLSARQKPEPPTP